MTAYGTFFANNDEHFNTEYEVPHGTLKNITKNPQIAECVAKNGETLYIRYANDVLTCRNKKTNELIAQGTPFIHKGEHITELKLTDIEFYLEMYSKFKINFV